MEWQIWIHLASCGKVAMALAPAPQSRALPRGNTLPSAHSARSLKEQGEGCLCAKCAGFEACQWAGFSSCLGPAPVHGDPPSSQAKYFPTMSCTIWRKYFHKIPTCLLQSDAGLPFSQLWHSATQSIGWAWKYLDLVLCMGNKLQGEDVPGRLKVAFLELKPVKLLVFQACRIANFSVNRFLQNKQVLLLRKNKY